MPSAERIAFKETTQQFLVRAMESMEHTKFTIERSEAHIRRSMELIVRSDEVIRECEEQLLMLGVLADRT